MAEEMAPTTCGTRLAVSSMTTARLRLRERK
jgi:hypothetical protein